MLMLWATVYIIKPRYAEKRYEAILYLVAISIWILTEYISRSQETIPMGSFYIYEIPAYVVWNYSSIPKLQRYSRWSSGMDK